MADSKQFAEAVARRVNGPRRPRPLIEMQGIRKSYYIGQPNELEILHGIDLKVYHGEFVAIVGESGSGKSTLMNIIGVLDKPTQGTYILAGVNIHEAPTLGPNSKDVLQDNMVFSIEPGVYFEGKFGIRIEDSVTLSGGTVVSFMHSDKKLTVL